MRTTPVFTSYTCPSLLSSFCAVEFPAVLLNTSTGEIESEFHTYVQPQEHPVLSEFCTELTGITQVSVHRHKYTITKIPMYFLVHCFTVHLTALFPCLTDASWGWDPPPDLSFSVQPLAAKPAAPEGCGLPQQTTEMFCTFTLSKTVYFPHMVR